MAKHPPCSSYLPDRHWTCADGFPVLSGFCFGCEGGVPVCCDEKKSAHFFPETGKPPEHLLRPRP